MLISNVCKGSGGTAHSEPAYVGIRWIQAYVSIRQHTSAYVSIRRHTSAYGSLEISLEKDNEHKAHEGEDTSSEGTETACIYDSVRRHTSAYVRRREHTSADVRIRQQRLAYAYL